MLSQPSGHSVTFGNGTGLPHWFSVVRLPSVPAVPWLHQVGADETTMGRSYLETHTLAAQPFFPPQEVSVPLPKGPHVPNRPVLVALNFLPKSLSFLGTLGKERRFKEGKWENRLSLKRSH